MRRDWVSNKYGPESQGKKFNPTTRTKHPRLDNSVYATRI